MILFLSILFAALISSAIGIFVVRRARKVSIQTTNEIIHNETWPHPLVGHNVAYVKNPTLDIGTVTRIDGSGRARIRRFDGTYVRRSLSRLVRTSEYADQEYRRVN